MALRPDLQARPERSQDVGAARALAALPGTGAVRVAALAILLLGCSVDVDKLRAPAPQARDAAADLPVGIGVADATEAHTDSVVETQDGDTAVAPPDSPGLDAFAGGDNGVDLSSPDAPDDAAAFDQLVSPLDTPLAAEDGGPTLAGEVSSGEGDGKGETAWNEGGGEAGIDGIGAEGASRVDSAEDGAGAAGSSGSGGSGGTGGGGGTGGSRGVGGSEEAGSGGSGGTTSALADGLVAYYPCDETAGSTLSDASGNGHNGLVRGTGGSGGYTFKTGHLGNALNLVKANQGYVSIPQGALVGATEMTIATWVYLNAGVDWQRVWDFGRGVDAYMFLTTRATNQKLRFAITASGYYGEKVVDCAAELPVQVWKHVAVVLGGAGALVYVDGQQVGNNSAISIRPTDLGSTSDNYIGRSRFSDDPYLDGNIDDFRIYRRALSAWEVQALYAYQVP